MELWLKEFYHFRECYYNDNKGSELAMYNHGHRLFEKIAAHVHRSRTFCYHTKPQQHYMVLSRTVLESVLCTDV